MQWPWPSRNRLYEVQYEQSIGIPSGLNFPLLLGMKTRLSGSGWYPLLLSDNTA